VLAPHTSLCLGVESFTEENRSPLHVGTYISVDVTVCKVTLVILHGVVSQDTCVPHRRTENLEIHAVLEWRQGQI
jgi:hypothetical protein